MTSSTSGPRIAYVLAPASGASSSDFRTNLNHRVTIVGVAESKAMPSITAGQKVDEKKLPKFTARSVVSLSDTCAAS